MILYLPWEYPSICTFSDNAYVQMNEFNCENYKHQGYLIINHLQTGSMMFVTHRTLELEGTQKYFCLPSLFFKDKKTKFQ